MEKLGDGRMEELEVTGSWPRKKTKSRMSFFCSDPAA
jgi:hypothetical protein